MVDLKAAETRFEELRIKAKESPVEIEGGEDADEQVGADVILDMLKQIADESRARGVIGEEEHAELLRCATRYAEVLSAIPADALHDILVPPDEDDDAELF